MLICIKGQPNNEKTINCKLIASIPALFAPLLSIVIFSGNPLDPIALIKKAFSAASSLILLYYDSLKNKRHTSEQPLG